MNKEQKFALDFHDKRGNPQTLFAESGTQVKGLAGSPWKVTIKPLFDGGHQITVLLPPTFSGFEIGKIKGEPYEPKNN